MLTIILAHFTSKYIEEPLRHKNLLPRDIYKGATITTAASLVAGILIAFQGVIALLDYFKVGMGKAEEKSRELASEVGNTAGEFRRLNVILQDGRISLEDRTEPLKKLKKEYPQAIELIKSYEDNLKTANNTIDDSIELEKAYTKVIIDEAKKRGARSMIEKKSESLFEIDEERTEQIENAKKALLKTALFRLLIMVQK